MRFTLLYFENVKNFYGYTNLKDFIFIDVFGNDININDLIRLFNIVNEVQLSETTSYEDIIKMYQQLKGNDIIMFIILLIKLNKIQVYNNEGFVDLGNMYMIVKKDNKPTIMKYSLRINKDDIIGFLIKTKNPKKPKNQGFLSKIRNPFRSRRVQPIEGGKRIKSIKRKITKKYLKIE